ncbi:MAG TPA: hypothetical protein VGI81_14845 [Tepidisphaeraceae bacterium]|jgi:hypothetical protein
MRGNIVTAATVFGIFVLVSSLVLVFGIRHVAYKTAAQIDAAVNVHAQAVERAGQNAGAPIRDSLETLSATFDRHAHAVEHAGDQIAHPAIPKDYVIQLRGPVAIQQPMVIRGPTQDGSLPVNAVVGK